MPEYEDPRTPRVSYSLRYPRPPKTKVPGDASFRLAPGGPTSRTPKPWPGRTPEFDEWSRQEQAELEQIHADYLARLKANEPVRRHYEKITEYYKQKHLEHLKRSNYGSLHDPALRSAKARRLPPMAGEGS